MHQSLIHFLTHFYCAFSSAFAFDAFAFAFDAFDAFATLASGLAFAFTDLRSDSVLSSGLGSGCSGSDLRACVAFVTFVEGGKSVQSLFEQGRNVGLQVHHPNALV